MSKLLKILFKSYFFDGLLLLGLGVFIVLRPDNTLEMLCIIIGSVLTAMGVIKMIIYFALKKEKREIFDLIAGVVQIILGVALIVKSNFFITVFQYVTGVILAYGALLMFMHSFSLRKNKGIMFVLSLIFACITAGLAAIIFIKPIAFASFMMQIYGISLIAEGLSMIIVLNKASAIKKK